MSVNDTPPRADLVNNNQQPVNSNTIDDCEPLQLQPPSSQTPNISRQVWVLPHRDCLGSSCADICLPKVSKEMLISQLDQEDAVDFVCGKDMYNMECTLTYARNQKLQHPANLDRARPEYEGPGPYGNVLGVAKYIGNMLQ